MLTFEESRETKETRINARLLLGSDEPGGIRTGIGFMDHMLDLMAFHGGFNLRIEAEGDLQVDSHHLVEDLGIVIGGLFAKLAKVMIEEGCFKRYSCCTLPMDEALVRVVLDVSGRGGAWFDHTFTVERLGNLETETLREFFIAFASSARCTMHLDVLKGRNNHHIAEALFKGLGRALREAYGTASIEKTSSSGQCMVSTKGLLELGGPE